jgi:DNA-dependent RNA polymerase auxiliary subunit epsilon
MPDLEAFLSTKAGSTGILFNYTNSPHHTTHLPSENNFSDGNLLCQYQTTNAGGPHRYKTQSFSIEVNIDSKSHTHLDHQADNRNFRDDSLLNYE